MARNRKAARSICRIRRKNTPFPMKVSFGKGRLFYIQKLLSSLRESIRYTIPPYLSIKSGRDEAG